MRDACRISSRPGDRLVRREMPAAALREPTRSSRDEGGSERSRLIGLAAAPAAAARLRRGPGGRAKRRAVLELKPGLVLWETGTHEAAVGGSVEAFGEAVQAGIEALRLAKVDLILIDMQYSPRTSSLIHFDPYVTALREVADQNDVPV